MKIPLAANRRTTEAARIFHLALGVPFPRDPTDAEILALVSREADFSDADPSVFRDRYWLAESFSKTPFDIGVDRVAAAKKMFILAEDQCRLANERLVDGFSRPQAPYQALERARQLVRSVLGPFSWDFAERFFSFGPGATFALRRRNAHHSNKWVANDVTRDCLPLLLAHWRRHPSLGQPQRVTIVEGNRVTTVPKDAKKDRTIAIEPTWNSFFQRGIGGAIRDRLRRRCGILLPDSQLRHQQLARQGSLDGSIATIDLKSASDSVSLALVELLLPSDWLQPIAITRSKSGTWDNEIYLYQKVSSMGNGFTFELESLLFWALTKAVCGERDISVYGDDIICPAERAGDVISLLNYVGFTTNDKKTFTTGSFRESCGGHFYQGHDVTPPYFRKLLNEPIHRIAAANTLSLRCASRYGWLRDGRFRGLHQHLTWDQKYFGPITASGAVHCPLDEAIARGTVQWSRRVQQWTFRELQPVRRYSDSNQVGGVLASLYGQVVTEESRFTSCESDRKVGKSLANGWDGPGPWI